MFYAETAQKAVNSLRDAKKGVPFAQAMAYMLQGRLMSAYGNEPRIM